MYTLTHLHTQLFLIFKIFKVAHCPTTRQLHFDLSILFVLASFLVYYFIIHPWLNDHKTHDSHNMLFVQLWATNATYKYVPLVCRSHSLCHTTLLNNLAWFTFVFLAGNSTFCDGWSNSGSWWRLRSAFKNASAFCIRRRCDSSVSILVSVSRSCVTENACRRTGCATAALNCSSSDPNDSAPDVCSTVATSSTMIAHNK